MLGMVMMRQYLVIIFTQHKTIRFPERKERFVTVSFSTKIFYLIMSVMRLPVLTQ